jgi:hypothetical protein
VERHLLPEVTTGPSEPAWSPDGRWIAFSMRGDIWKVPAAGGEAVALTEGPAYHFEPAWSPDGTRIALTFDDDGNLDIGIVSAEGGPVQRITMDARVDIEPTWSKDGTELFYVSARGGPFRIHRYRLSDGRDTAIVNGFQPAVSPDGKQLAYVAPVSGRLGTGGIWIKELPDGQPRLVHYEETEYRVRPAWTEDAQALLYVSDEAGSNDVAIVPVNGGNPVILTADARDEYSPSPSPDGQRFAFISNRSGPMRLYVSAMGGGPLSSWHEVPVRSRRARQATGRVRLKVTGPDGHALPARVYVSASDGRAYAPNDGFHRVIAATETHYFHTAGESEVELPVGPAVVEVMHGHEYRPARLTVEIAENQVREAAFRLERLIDLPARGWYSGDTHVHDLHQGRYGITHETFFLQLVSEDLHVTNALVHMDGTRLMGRWADLTGRPHPLSTPQHILQYGEEYRGSLGHVGMLGVQRYVLPFTGGVNATAYAQHQLDLMYFDSARAQGGLAGFMHPFNSPVTRPQGAAGSLIPLDVALGRGDFYDIGALVSDERGSAELYYRLLNAGFRIAATAGTDNFSDVFRDPPPGADRTYVRIDGPLTLSSWLDGIRAQRTFASTGPILLFEVDGHEPGEEIALENGSPAGLRVRAEAISITPLDTLAILVNGRVAHAVTARDSFRIQFDNVVAIPEGGWIAARVSGPSSRLVTDSYAFAQTSPVYVVRGGQPYRSAEDARFLSQAVSALWTRVENTRWRSTAERQRFLSAVEEARAVYDRIAASAESVK